jgi:hypothetical protein
MASLPLRFPALVIAAAAAWTAHASNLANPAVAIPAARVGVGASYHLGGYTITDLKIPCLLNRWHIRGTYSPVSFLNIGLDAGVARMDVAADTSEDCTTGVFNGGFGPSGGGHLKVSTPFFFNGLVALIGIAQGTYFYSQDKDEVRYAGPDGAATAGIQVHIPGFGYIAAGPQLYLIKGRTRSYDGSRGKYSNVNNVRGWMAFDLFPPSKLEKAGSFYISAEFTVSPQAEFGGRAPIQEFGFSIAVGSVTKRLYGEEAGKEWKP